MDKKVLIIVGAVVVVSAVLGLGVAGVIPIPGLTHAKAKKKNANADSADKKDDKAAQATAAQDKAKEADELAKTKKVADEAAKTAAIAKAALDKQISDQKGFKKLAGVWGEMKPDDVGVLILEHYKPEDAAPILKLMDEDQVAAIFTAMAASKKSDNLASAAKSPDVAQYGDALAKEVSKPDPALPAKS